MFFFPHLFVCFVWYVFSNAGADANDCSTKTDGSGNLLYPGGVYEIEAWPYCTDAIILNPYEIHKITLKVGSGRRLMEDFESDSDSQASLEDSEGKDSPFESQKHPSSNVQVRKRLRGLNADDDISISGDPAVEEKSLDEVLDDGAADKGPYCSSNDFPCINADGAKSSREGMVQVCHYSVFHGYQQWCVTEEDSIMVLLHDNDYCGPCVGGFNDFIKEHNRQG